eukprot:659633-Amphidinium_carterae.1
MKIRHCNCLESQAANIVRLFSFWPKFWSHVTLCPNCGKSGVQARQQQKHEIAKMSNDEIAVQQPEVADMYQGDTNLRRPAAEILWTHVRQKK